MIKTFILLKGNLDISRWVFISIREEKEEEEEDGC